MKETKIIIKHYEELEVDGRSGKMYKKREVAHLGLGLADFFQDLLVVSISLHKNAYPVFVDC